MERNSRFYVFSSNKSAQKRKREEDETLDRSKAKEKPADKKKRSNGETNGTSVDTTKCSVCLDTVRSSIMKSLPCAHVFHEICINEWLKKSDICPICRWPITVETNDSPQMGATRLRETLENYEDEYNGSAESELDGWNISIEIYEWSDEFESVEVNDESESEVNYDSESEEVNDESESEEVNDESESEESSDESESEESSDESESEKSSDESDSEESRDESESEESTDESE